MLCIKQFVGLLLMFVLVACSTAPKHHASDLAKTEYKAAIDVMQAGDTENALKLFSKITQDYPELAGPHANLGLLYQTLGRVKDATEAFDRAISLQPDSARIYNSAAVFYRSQGRFKDAESAYLNAIDKAPDYVAPVLNLGILYDLYLHQPAMAIKYYRQYLFLTGDDDEKVALWLADLERRQP